MNKVALVTGITGQDGSYLAELLLEKNYRVVGLSKNKNLADAPHLQHIKSKIEFSSGDIADPISLKEVILKTKPDEIYNLASQSHPGESWNLALETAKINGFGAHLLFDTIKQFKPDCRIYQASSSDMFGEITESPQNEETPFKPLNPYSAAKLYAHNMARIYRQSFNLFISCGILFNHESPRRGMHFITQKVCYAAACLKLGIKNSPILNEKGEPIVKNGTFALGNLEAKRDWGFAGDYAEAMWLMLQQDQPDDFVIGTGKIRTIRQLCESAFSYVNLDYKNYILTDNRFVRVTETGHTMADIDKAKKILKWEPKVGFDEIIHQMVDFHLKELIKQAQC